MAKPCLNLHLIPLLPLAFWLMRSYLVSMSKRYIAATHTHAHRFAVSAELDAQTLTQDRAATGWLFDTNMQEVYWRGACPQCSSIVRLHAHPVRGKKSTGHCDDRCTSATGFNCECQCAGKNHGSDHAA